MSLGLLTLSLLTASSAQAQACGPDVSDHCWQITYATSNNVDLHYVRDVPTIGQSTLTDSQGGSNIIDGDEESTVATTLTWMPANGDAALDPPPDKDHPVHLIEHGYAYESSLGGGSSSPSSGSGTADDGLGDPRDGGGISQGNHLIVKDGSSGTITLDPVALKAINPVSTYQSDYPGGGGGGGGYPGGGGPGWDWTGGEGAISFYVYLDPSASPRAVTISANVDPTYYKVPDANNPVDDNGDVNYYGVAHIRAADGTMSGDVGLPITEYDTYDHAIGPVSWTPITYHANLSGIWQTANSSYNWFSSLKQQGSNGALYPPDFTNSYLDPYWINTSNVANTPPNAVAPGDTNPNSADHIHITCVDGGDGDGAVATANYFMTLHAAMEKNYPDHTRKGIENLRMAPNATYVRATQNNEPLVVYAEQSYSWSLSASTAGPVGDFIADILQINMSVSYTYSFNAGVQATLQNVPEGYATYLEIFDAYQYHYGKVDDWGMDGYDGTTPYIVKVPDSPAGGYQAHAPPIYLGN